MKLVLPVKKNDKFKYYLRFLNPILKCTKRELDVLAVLMSLHYTNVEKLNGDFKGLLLSAATRKAVSGYLKMTIYQYNNIICSLRKKKLIVENQLNSDLVKGDSKEVRIDILFVDKED